MIRLLLLSIAGLAAVRALRDIVRAVPAGLDPFAGAAAMPGRPGPMPDPTPPMPQPLPDPAPDPGPVPTR